MLRLTDAIKHLLIINVLFFVASQMYQNEIYGLFSLWFPEHPNFQSWQIITHMFMHASPEHIFFNMFTLWMFGSAIELAWGKQKFLFFYFSAGIGAALVQTGVNYYQFNEGLNALVNAGVSEYDIINVMSEGKYSPGWYDVAKGSLVENMIGNYMGYLIGASGATSGVMAAYGFMFAEREIRLLFFPVPLKAKYFIPLMFVGDLYYGLSGGGGNVAYFAHIGGALFGLFMVWYWKKNQFNNNRWN